jgi:Helix-turn-helix domain
LGINEIETRFNSVETAAMLGVSMRTLARLRAEGRIGYLNVGVGVKRQTIYFTQRHIDQYLASTRHEVKVKAPRR